MRMFPALGAVGAISLVLTGCAGAAGQPGSADDGLQIVATTTQLADVTRELVGDAAEVTSLLQPGASAHSFDPGPAALSALADADLLIVNGAGLETWLDDTVEASGFAGTVVDTSEALELIAAEGDPHEGHDHGAEGGAGEAEHEGETAEEHAEHADEEPAEETGHEGHDHGEFDPHVWNDPANVILQALSLIHI